MVDLGYSVVRITEDPKKRDKNPSHSRSIPEFLLPLWFPIPDCITTETVLRSESSNCDNLGGMGPWTAARTVVWPDFHSADPSQLVNVPNSHDKGRIVVPSVLPSTRSAVMVVRSALCVFVYRLRYCYFRDRHYTNVSKNPLGDDSLCTLAQHSTQPCDHRLLLVTFDIGLFCSSYTSIQPLTLFCRSSFLLSLTNSRGFVVAVFIISSERANTQKPIRIMKQKNNRKQKNGQKGKGEDKESAPTRRSQRKRHGQNGVKGNSWANDQKLRQAVEGGE